MAKNITHTYAAAPGGTKIVLKPLGGSGASWYALDPEEFEALKTEHEELKRAYEDLAAKTEKLLEVARDERAVLKELVELVLECSTALRKELRAPGSADFNKTSEMMRIVKLVTPIIKDYGIKIPD